MRTHSGIAQPLLAAECETRSGLLAASLEFVTNDDGGDTSRIFYDASQVAQLHKDACKRDGEQNKQRRCFHGDGC